MPSKSTDQNSAAEQIAGRNGVVIRHPHREGRTGSGYRTYEVHQRERVGQSTEKIRPVQLSSHEYRRDPYPLMAILREHYPCYRDWLANAYWLTRYDDVTSVFADDANFESRSKAWRYGLGEFGRDLGNELPVLETYVRRIDELAETIAGRLAHELVANGGGDLATGFAARFPLELLVGLLDIPEPDAALFCERYWRMQRGTTWNPRLQQEGRRAMQELVAYFETLLAQRRHQPGDDLVSTISGLDPADGPVTAADVVRTLLEGDHETLHGTLANLWYLLLTHPQEFARARSDRRLLKLACLETLRHSPPVLSAHRHTRHEVERFGRLLPEGALVVCSAAGANRDPRVFRDPDRFVVNRKDLCQREPRGQYRADGLASGIAFGLGKPSVHPAVPEDRPRSHYAVVRDTVVTASRALLDVAAEITLRPGAEPQLGALTVGEMHTCWKLPVEINGRSPT